MCVSKEEIIWGWGKRERNSERERRVCVPFSHTYLFTYILMGGEPVIDIRFILLLDCY